MVNLEVKENQGPVFCPGVLKAVVQDPEGCGALQLEVTGLAAAVGQLSGGLQHRKANRSGVCGGREGAQWRCEPAPVSRCACLCVHECGRGGSSTWVWWGHLCALEGGHVTGKGKMGPQVSA